MDTVEYAVDFVRDAQTDHAMFGHAYARKKNKQFLFSILKSAIWLKFLQFIALVHCVLPFWQISYVTGVITTVRFLFVVDFY